MQLSGAGLIHRGLSRTRVQLRAHGVAYVGHADLAALAHVAGWKRGVDWQRDQVANFERELMHLVANEKGLTARRRGGRVTLLSSDHLLGADTIGRGDTPLFRPHAEMAVAQVIDALNASSVRIVLCVQRQDRLMELAYLRAIEAGEHHSFAEQFPYGAQPLLDYGALVDRLRAMPRVSSVIVRPVEPIFGDAAAFLDDFLGVVGLSGSLDLDRTPSSLTRRYSPQGLNLALALNQHLEADVERVRVRKFLLANFSTTDPHGNRFLSDTERTSILRTYAMANRRLFASTLPHLPSDTYDNDARTELLVAMQRSYRPASTWRKIARIRNAATLRLAIAAGRRRLARVT